VVEDCQSCFATDLPIFNHPLLRVVALSVLRIVVARKVSFSYIVTKGEPEIVLIKHDSCSGNTTSKSGLWLGSRGRTGVRGYVHGADRYPGSKCRRLAVCGAGADWLATESICNVDDDRTLHGTGHGVLGNWHWTGHGLLSIYAPAATGQRHETSDTLQTETATELSRPAARLTKYLTIIL